MVPANLEQHHGRRIVFAFLWVVWGQVKNKSWFGIMESYSVLNEMWSVLEANATFATQILAGAEAWFGFAGRVVASVGVFQNAPVQDDVHSEGEAESPHQEREGDEPDLEPQTCAAFQLLRESYDNTAAFVADLLGDRRLQKRVRLIVFALKPLHVEYGEDLRRHGEGFAETMYFQGDRACGAWYQQQVAQTLALLQDGRAVELFDLQPAPTRLEYVKTPEDAYAAEDLKILEQLYVFIIELCANRVWSQAFWTLSLPYALAGYFSSALSDRSRTQTKLQVIAHAVLKLESMLRDPRRLGDRKGQAKALQMLQRDLGTTGWQLTREALVVGREHDWCPTSPALREFCRTIFSGPVSTKDTLEAPFNYLKDSVAVSKHKIMSPWTRYFYLMANPTCKNAGVQPILPSPDDFEALLRSKFQDSDVTNLKPFHFGRTMLGPEFPRPDKLIGEWRAAGFHSNRKSAAAYAYLLAENHVEFRNVQNVWAGWCLKTGSGSLYLGSGTTPGPIGQSL